MNLGIYYKIDQKYTKLALCVVKLKLQLGTYIIANGHFIGLIYNRTFVRKNRPISTRKQQLSATKYSVQSRWIVVSECLWPETLTKMTFWADNIKFIKDVLDSKYKKVEDSLADVSNRKIIET